MARRRITGSIWTRLAVVAVFAVAMAFMEAAVVVYLRELFHITGGLVTSAPAAKDIWFSVPFFTLLKPGALAGVLPQSVPEALCPGCRPAGGAGGRCLRTGLLLIWGA